MTNLISLNIFTDFCSTWWLWWILPFILGCTLGVVVMKKWKSMYHELTQETRVGRNKLKDSEQRLEELIKEQKDLKGQLAIQRGKIRELETKLLGK